MKYGVLVEDQSQPVKVCKICTTINAVDCHSLADAVQTICMNTVSLVTGWHSYIKNGQIFISSTNSFALFQRVAIFRNGRKCARDGIILCHTSDHTDLSTKSKNFAHLRDKNNCVRFISSSDLKLAFTSDLWKHTSIQTTGLTVFVLDSDHIQFISGLDSS